MKVIVCGGREYGQEVAEEQHLFAVLDAQHALSPIDLVIQGGARGADSMARLWAESRAIDCLAVPAKWDAHGRGAGPIRNARMLDYKPDMVIAFPGGRGTADMVRRANAAGIQVREVQ
ncbi:DUF2493 domain-containing protein [Burkholderia ubonensis]|uniref:DUF2493 domain-containing protein n=1 Tax=Burkholderia ubonensis TaxID=101571 RepID=UPI0009B3D76E|nr:DUF2493 domain-containing protein [Burkholderia ubonensis]